MPLSALILVFVLTPFLAADDTAKPLSPEEAAKQVNEKVMVKMEVKSAALREGVCFLNSQEAKIDDPAAHYKGKTILVTGKVTLYREKPQIAVEGPDQIQVEEKKP